MSDGYSIFGGNQSPLSPGFLYEQMPVSIFGSGGPPRYTGPANFNTGMGGNGMSAMLQMLMPFILSKMANNGRVPAQFFPEQGFYEQMQAQEFFMANQQAMQMATQSDTAAINRTIGGFSQMMGEEQTTAVRERNFRIASTTSQMMPMLTQMLGPDLVDSLHGSRGSAAIFASQLHSALRTSRDPVTGAIGMSGESAGNISRGVYEKLFGEDYNPATLRGMSAGQAGMLAKELQTRGLLGVPLGGLGLEERRAALPDDISDATFRRIARDTKAIRELGGDATQEQLDAATAGVRNTYAKLKDNTTGPLTAADIDNEDAMPGGADLMRTADASRIAGRLKNMSGAVKAMREIFGDMGNPNAPMREIVDGLNKLTQGGLSSMSAEKLEMTVRKTQAIAKQTGMSVEGIMALTDQATQMGDPLGLHRKQAVFNAQQSALFAASGADSLYLDSRISGQVSAEHLAAADLQLRTHATAAPAANQMRAAIRMLNTGMVAPAEGSKLAKYIEAIKTGSKDYEFRMEEADYVDMLAEGPNGANRGAVEMLLRDRLGNQSYGDEYDIGGTVRRNSMPRDAVQNLYGAAVRDALNMTTIAGGQELRDAGILKSDDELQIMTRDVGQGFMQDFLATDAKTFNNNNDRTNHFKEALQTRIIEQLEKKMPLAPPAVVAAAAESFMAKSGGAGQLVESIYAAINTTAGTDVNAKTAPGVFAMYGDTAFKAMEARNRQAAADAIMGRAFAGLGTAGPMARVMDILQSTGAEGITSDKVLQALGSVSSADIKGIDPTGPLATSLGLWAKGKKFDPNKPEELEQLEFTANAIMALTGGDIDFSKEFRQKYATSKWLTEDANLMKHATEAAAGNFNVYEKELAKNPLFFSNISQAELDQVTQLGERAMKRVDEKTVDGKPTPLTKKSSEFVDDYIKHSTEQAQRVHADKNAMLHLGKGSEAEVQAIVTYNQQLQAAAADQQISVAELLRTNDDARELFGRSVEAAAGISKKYNTPKNTPMTEAEKRELDAYIEFETQYVTAEEKRDAAIKGILEVTPAAQREDLRTDTAETMLNDLLADPSRSSGVAKAVRAKKEILQMALNEKVFGATRKLDDLTPEEMADADDRLNLQDMSTEQRAHFDRLKADAKILDGLDSGDKTIDLKSLQEAVEAIPMTQANAAGGNNRMDVVVTGTFEELETGRKIKIIGEGDAFSKALMRSSIA